MGTKKENILAVETRGLTKLYGDKAAVRDLNLKVGEGQIVVAGAGFEPTTFGL